ncbi:helix-turn-helix domain-containing protein [Sphingomonas sp. LB3N6]|uniref:helix-turn-helix domain-containing protein n=1 Tax=Sphingomonas fucosidasi TaxID=3096164 RepID=UPI003FA6E705
MSSGVRLREERKRLGLTQAELAERAGTDTQKQSLYETSKRKLVGDYLANLARLGIDTQYVLTGQRSGGEALTSEEGSIVHNARQLRDADRQALVRLTALMSGHPLPAKSYPTLPSEDALARMFEGILAGEDLSADPSDVARMLARHLPDALEQTRDVAPDQPPAASPSADTLPPPPARPRRASPRSPRT